MVIKRGVRWLQFGGLADGVGVIDRGRVVRGGVVKHRRGSYNCSIVPMAPVRWSGWRGGRVKHRRGEL